MGKYTYISLENRKHGHISWEKLAEIGEITVEEYKEAYKTEFGHIGIDCRPPIEGVECPFGERDLMNDTCYIGSGQHKCPYFERYSFEEGDNYGTIVCSHPPVQRAVQLELF